MQKKLFVPYIYTLINFSCGNPEMIYFEINEPMMFTKFRIRFIYYLVAIVALLCQDKRWLNH